MKTFAALFLFSGLAVTACAQQEANALADAVVKASGGDNWSRVQTLDFTFNVAQGGKVLVSAQHHWDVAANTDMVTSNGKTVTVNLGEANADGDAKAAFQRWTNDSYWLLAPLKLRDRGVHLRRLESGKNPALEVSFDAIGLTPKDRYVFYINSGTHLPEAWDYMPSSDKKMHATWEKYQETGGLKLATEHQMGDKHIFFTDLKVAP